MPSQLFDFLTRQHQGPWGRVLDAGTGVNSATWLAGLPTESLTLVTGSERHARQVLERVKLRPSDRLLVGNWADGGFLVGERFDTVVADYLVGAIEGFAPYFQEALFDRLAKLTAGRLYLVGLDPYVVQEPEVESGRLVWEIGRYRDACLLLAGEQPYREYPAEWVVGQLQHAGFTVSEARRFPIRYKARFVNAQIDMALMRVARLPNTKLAASLVDHGEALRARALNLADAEDGLRHGFDYVIVADRQGGAP
ncbi:class I SAM-dependent methyltransferase [Phenylobacterium sp. J426]|uniref:class I SAM-dependent methyltransferase n=1 Tax=Phenylobacterium sp. J426 TaxID=2898439 RepID=UPI0021517BF4|nr:class I SAM-dependent methyltransferase [Phenylobacterium sp. J426]MCR5876250.1 class I SAM-dependent methyltransferase [Phenylobacterium sp. J426]